MLDLELLASLDLKIKDIIDENYHKCSCDAEGFKWINRILIVRKGISLDMQILDEAGAVEKMALLESMITAGEDFNCGC